MCLVPKFELSMQICMWFFCLNLKIKFANCSKFFLPTTVVIYKILWISMEFKVKVEFSSNSAFPIIKQQSNNHYNYPYHYLSLITQLDRNTVQYNIIQRSTTKYFKTNQTTATFLRLYQYCVGILK